MIKLAKLYPYTLGLLVFFQTLLPKYTPIFIGATLLIGVIGLVKKEFIWSMALPFKLFIIFFLLYFVGTFYSKDPSLAAKYMEYKLSFVALPIVFSIHPKERFSLFIPAVIFIAGIVISMVVVLGHFVISLANNSLIDSLSGFSTIHHPTYYASYLFLGILISFYAYRNNWRGFNKLTVGLFIAIGLLCYCLTVSLAAILFLGLFVLILLWKVVLNKYGIAKSMLIGCGLSVMFTVGIYATPLKDDFHQTYTSFVNYIKSPSDFLEKGNRYLTGNETRLILWTVAAQNIVEHPFGVGTGSVDFYTTKELVKYNMIDMASYKYNPHNQFLQIWLEIGFIGLTIFIALFYFFYNKGKKTRNWLLTILICNILFNCFFESMFQRQSGIVFYTFWLCLLYVHSQWNIINSQEEN